MTIASRYAARIVLPRWDPDARVRLERAGISIFRDPGSPLINEPVDITLELDATSEIDARVQIGRALKGWATISPLDFVIVAPY
jgi:hypothetical protein